MKDTRAIVGIVGKPGSGKSTLVQALKKSMIYLGAEEDEIEVFSLGKLLRQEVENETPRGWQIADFLEKNLLLPQGFVDHFVSEHIRACTANIIIIDGYPRCAASVAYMEKKFQEQYSLAFVKSTVPDEVALQRKQAESNIGEQLEEYHEVSAPAWKEMMELAPDNHFVVEGTADLALIINQISRRILVNG